jgi:hypothetical protein
METVRLLNQVIPKPSLNGVTPADLHQGVSSTKVEGKRQYRDRGQQKPDTPPWNRNYWDVLKGAMGLENMTRLVELVTKFCFFCPRPLRKIANLGLEGVG